MSTGLGPRFGAEGCDRVGAPSEKPVPTMQRVQGSPATLTAMSAPAPGKGGAQLSNGLKGQRIVFRHGACLEAGIASLGSSFTLSSSLGFARLPWPPLASSGLAERAKAQRCRAGTLENRSLFPRGLTACFVCLLLLAPSCERASNVSSGLSAVRAPFRARSRPGSRLHARPHFLLLRTLSLPSTFPFA